MEPQYSCAVTLVPHLEGGHLGWVSEGRPGLPKPVQPKSHLLHRQLGRLSMFKYVSVRFLYPIIVRNLFN